MLLFCMAAGKFTIKLAYDSTVRKLSIRMSDTQVTVMMKNSHPCTVLWDETLDCFFADGSAGVGALWWSVVCELICEEICPSTTGMGIIIIVGFVYVVGLTTDFV